MSNTELVLACVFQTASVAIAVGGIIICIVFEVQCNRIEKDIERKRKHLGFSKEVNRLLEMES